MSDAVTAEVCGFTSLHHISIFFVWQITVVIRVSFGPIPTRMIGAALVDQIDQNVRNRWTGPVAAQFCTCNRAMVSNPMLEPTFMVAILELCGYGVPYRGLLNAG